MPTITGLSAPEYRAPRDRPLRILLIGAHPDDGEIKAGATAHLWARQGHKVKVVSVTDGRFGHHEMHGAELVARRKKEAVASAAVLEIEEAVLGNPDGELLPTLERRCEMIRLIRDWQADIVITHRPNDYHPDHRYTSILVQDAAFLVTVPNYLPDSPSLERLPVCLFFDDHFSEPTPFRPDIVVDTTPVRLVKRRCLAAMPSQFMEWLPWNAGFSGEVPEGEEEQLEFLETRFMYRDAVAADRYRDRLGELYDPENARGIRYAEAFQLSEYGSQPSVEELQHIFPLAPTEPIS